MRTVSLPSRFVLALVPFLGFPVGAEAQDFPEEVRCQGEAGELSTAFDDFVNCVRAQVAQYHVCRTHYYVNDGIHIFIGRCVHVANWPFVGYDVPPTCEGLFQDPVDFYRCFRAELINGRVCDVMLVEHLTLEAYCWDPEA